MWQNYDPRDAVTDISSILIYCERTGFYTVATVNPEAQTIIIIVDPATTDRVLPADLWPETWYWSFPPDQVKQE